MTVRLFLISKKFSDAIFQKMSNGKGGGNMRSYFEAKVIPPSDAIRERRERCLEIMLIGQKA